MPDVTITMSDEQITTFRNMGVKDFGLDADCVVEEVLDFIVDSNYNQREHEKCDEQWHKMGLTEKQNRLKLTVPTEP